jgi:ribosomal protein L31
MIYSSYKQFLISTSYKCHPIFIRAGKTRETTRDQAIDEPLEKIEKILRGKCVMNTGLLTDIN